MQAVVRDFSGSVGAGQWQRGGDFVRRTAIPHELAYPHSRCYTASVFCVNLLCGCSSGDPPGSSRKYSRTKRSQLGVPPLEQESIDRFAVRQNLFEWRLSTSPQRAHACKNMLVGACGVLLSAVAAAKGGASFALLRIYCIQAAAVQRSRPARTAPTTRPTSLPRQDTARQRAWPEACSTQLGPRTVVSIGSVRGRTRVCCTQTENLYFIALSTEAGPGEKPPGRRRHVMTRHRNFEDRERAPRPCWSWLVRGIRCPPHHSFMFSRALPPGLPSSIQIHLHAEPPELRSLLRCTYEFRLFSLETYSAPPRAEQRDSDRRR